MAKVAILTNFMEFNPGYSLTGIVKDQARMLTSHGHEVHLFVNDQYHGETFSEDVTLHKKIPFAHLIDYRSMKEITPEHQQIVEKTKNMLVAEMLQFDFAFTHDFVFTGWFMIYGLGVSEASPHLPNIRWLHWIHSVPSLLSDWWNIRMYGQRHKLVFPNATERTRVAEQYRGAQKDVRVIHHIKDLRSWFDFHEETCDFIEDHPGVMQADIVQIYPASSDRLSAKGIPQLSLMFSKMKKKGFSVCLVIANQWATGRQRKEDLERFEKIASRNGLKINKEFIFTSEWRREYETGIPKHMLRELLQCSNLFVFPTREESFGLVAPEAALAGGVLMVHNKSLSMMAEVHGYTGLYVDFGSFHNQFTPPNEEAYYSDVAQIILGRMRENESVTSKTFIRQNYNWDRLYEREYSPIMAESKTWAV